MKLSRPANWVFRNELRAQITVIAFMIVYYGAYLTNFTFDFTFAVDHGLTFNSMLEHLVHGRFDVDPDVVRDEGFQRGGRVYAYWGIFGALIRLPLFAFRNGMELDVTRLSCLVAVSLAGAMTLRTALFVRRYCSPAPASDAAFTMFTTYVVFGGAQVGYLEATIYQEVVFWAAAIGAAFVYCAVKGLLLNRFSTGLLNWMALLCGLGLLTRVSTGMGLYAAEGLLLAALIIEAGINGESSRALAGRVAAVILSPRILLPAAILAGFVVVTGVINYFRWGSPTSFADYSTYITYKMYPDRTASMDLFGLFNLVRVPFGLGYYFVPVWAFQGTNGGLPFHWEQARLFDIVELPPSSFFLTDLLPIVFIACLIASIVGGRLPRPISLARLLALAAGLLVPCLLMLAAINMAYRFRMEFYPEIDLLALLGFYVAAREGGVLSAGSGAIRWYPRGIAAATLISIASAHITLLLYKMLLFGPAQIYLRHGVAHLYYWSLLSAMRSAGLSH
jgi:hypothetical protein